MPSAFKTYFFVHTLSCEAPGLLGQIRFSDSSCESFLRRLLKRVAFAKISRDKQVAIGDRMRGSQRGEVGFVRWAVRRVAHLSFPML